MAAEQKRQFSRGSAALFDFVGAVVTVRRTRAVTSPLSTTSRIRLQWRDLLSADKTISGEDDTMAEQRRFAPVRRQSVTSFGPGQDCLECQPGDFILTHGDALTSRIIRFGQRLRIHGDDRVYTRWNHAAVVVSDRGDLVEALGRGVCRTQLSKYTGSDYVVVRIDASEEDRRQAAAFALWAAGTEDQNGLRYGFVTIVSIAYTLVTGGKFTFGLEGQAICSGLVARAMERTSAIFSRTPSHIMPADLAKYYCVEVPGHPAARPTPTMVDRAA